MRAIKADEKRKRAKDLFDITQREIEKEGQMAFKDYMKDVENKNKSNIEMGQKKEVDMYKSFQNYMHMQDQRKEQMKSLDDKEAVNAIDRLGSLENKIRFKNDIYK